MKNFVLTLFAIMILGAFSPALEAQRGSRSAEVTRSGDTWTASVSGSPVYTGSDMIHAIQAGIDNLTSGRTHQETVNIRDSGSTGVHHWDGGVKVIDMRSYTVLDFHGNTINVNDTEDNLIVPIRAREADHIEIRNMRITGNPRYGMWFFGCENVLLSNIELNIPETQNSNGPGLGVRFEARGGQTSGRWNRNVEIDHIVVEGSKGHGVEFWGTDGLTIGTVVTRNTGGAGLLINNNRNVHVGLVDAYRANHGGGYAGFRTANNAGPNIVVDKVIAVECGRGVFTVSGSRGITIHEVDIIGSTSHGMLIEDTQDFVVNGGIIRGTGSEGVRITSRSSTQHHATQNVTVRNLRVSDCPWGIRETLPRTNSNFIFNNDLRGNDNCLAYDGPDTQAAANFCGIRAVRTDDLYLAWLHRRFMDGSEPEADPSHDHNGLGVPNLMRYALDIDHDDDLQSRLPQTEFVGGHLALRFFRSAIKEDIAYIVEASSNLNDWDEVLYDSRIHTQPNNAGAYMRIEDPQSAANNGARFIRLRVEQID